MKITSVRQAYALLSQRKKAYSASVEQRKQAQAHWCQLNHDTNELAPLISAKRFDLALEKIRQWRQEEPEKNIAYYKWCESARQEADAFDKVRRAQRAIMAVKANPGRIVEVLPNGVIIH